MKKIFIMLMVAMMAMTAQAQVKFGLKGGLNATQLNLKSYYGEATAHNNAGFFVGPTVKCDIPLAGLGVDASVLYSQSQFKSSTIDISSLSAEETTVKQQYVAVPINVRYTFGFGDTANLFIFAGPQFNFNVGNKEVSVIKDFCDWKNKSSQVCVNVGVGTTLFNHLQISVNYNIACAKNTEAQVLQDVDNVKAGTSIASVKTNLWQVGVAYWF